MADDRVCEHTSEWLLGVAQTHYDNACSGSADNVYSQNMLMRSIALTNIVLARAAVTGES